jgi:hypothetical protein
MKKCKTCNGYGLHAMGFPTPMGHLDALDGMPTQACPECGANPNSVKKKANLCKKSLNLCKSHKKHTKIPQKVPTMNPEYIKIVDEIIAKKLPVQEALMEIFEKCYGVSVTTIDVTSKCKKITPKSHK